jgi:hypothetical protein
MILKKENPDAVLDFHPISIIDLFSKLLSKVLVNKLSRVLSELF